MSKKLTAKEYHLRRCPYCLKVWYVVSDEERKSLNEHIIKCRHKMATFYSKSFIEIGTKK